MQIGSALVQYIPERRESFLAKTGTWHLVVKLLGDADVQEVTALLESLLVLRRTYTNPGIVTVVAGCNDNECVYLTVQECSMT